MAPAAARTIADFLNDTDTKPQNYDLILTGDLGYTGSELLYQLLEQDYKINFGGDGLFQYHPSGFHHGREDIIKYLMEEKER